MAHVLITGATGFLGGAVARALADGGHRVRCTGRDVTRGRALAARGLDFEPAELCDRQAVSRLCRDVEAVVHCAALSSPWGPRAAFERANVDATQAVLDACRAQGVRRLVHISTPSIYMGAGHRTLVREDDPLPPPINHYAATKWRAEERVRGSGVPALILRPRALFGPGDTTILPRLLRALQRGRLPVLGDGQNQVDLTYIDNAVHAVERALVAPPAALGQAFNITNGEPVYLWAFVRRVCEALQQPPPRGRLPAPVAMAAAHLLETIYRFLPPDREPVLTRYTVEVLTRTMTLDIRRAREVLGYAPTVRVDEGLARFARWWRAGCPDVHGAPSEPAANS